MAYLKLSTMEYPRHECDVRLEHPEIGEKFVLPDGWAEVESIAPPIEESRTQRLQMEPPEFVNGEWRRVWAVRDTTDDEKAEWDRASGALDEGDAPDAIP